eukprot:308709-Rhodomonas_salina.1
MAQRTVTEDCHICGEQIGDSTKPIWAQPTQPAHCPASQCKVRACHPECMAQCINSKSECPFCRGQASTLQKQWAALPK